MNELQKAYLLLQENCGIQVGDTVRVLRKADDYENGWINEWTKNPGYMDSFIGEKSKVCEIDESGIALLCDNADCGDWHFPFFVLEKLAPDWTEKLCEDVPALCYVNNGSQSKKLRLVVRKDNDPVRPFDTVERCSYEYAELAPKELLQAILERYYA